MRKILCFMGMILCTLMLFSCKDKGFEKVELSNNMKEQIALDYIEYLSIDEKEPEYGGKFSCPGKYKNIYFVSLLSSWVYDVVVEFPTENSYVRINYGGYPLVAYMDHSFYKLEDLYKEGKLSEKALLELNEYTDENTPLEDGKNWQYSYENKKLI